MQVLNSKPMNRGILAIVGDHDHRFLFPFLLCLTDRWTGSPARQLTDLVQSRLQNPWGQTYGCVSRIIWCGVSWIGGGQTAIKIDISDIETPIRGYRQPNTP